VRFWLGAVEYHHDELGLDDAGLDGIRATLNNHAQEAKVETTFMPMTTALGTLISLIGVQFDHQQIDTAGDAGSLLGSARLGSARLGSARPAPIAAPPISITSSGSTTRCEAPPGYVYYPGYGQQLPGPNCNGTACRFTTRTATWSDGRGGQWRSAPGWPAIVRRHRFDEASPAELRPHAASASTKGGYIYARPLTASKSCC
jgi:hypothetical protein